MKLFAYVVARDYGFAPNPFFGYCTLATCKPKIRGQAQVGDWVIGSGSKRFGLDTHLVFAMNVAEVLSYDQYWDDPRFRVKRPNLHGSVNIADADGYRYHDIFHIANAVFLGWSPVVRALLRCKRKSQPHIDENEDGARAGFSPMGKFRAQTLPFSMSHRNEGSGFPNLPFALPDPS